MTTLVRRVGALVLALALLGLAAPAADAAATSGGAAAATGTCRRTLAHYPILHPGDRRPAVRTLQCALNDLGLGPVAVDGYYGPQTRHAVYRIVSHFEGGLPPHPFRINNGMWTLLYGGQLPDRDLSEGDHGHAVLVLQRALRAAGGDLAVDGHFGPQTAAVVIGYQKAQQLKPTGSVDENTRFLLSMGGVIGHLN